MHVTAFSEDHVPILEEWLLKRKMPLLVDIPKLGWVCYEGLLPVVMVFMTTAENGLGIIDGLIANPEVKDPLRGQAVYTVMEELFIEVRHKGIKKLVAWTSNESTLMKAVNLGFSPLRGNILISREL